MTGVLWGRVYEPAGAVNGADPDNPNTRPHTPCVVCGRPVDPDIAHTPHEDGCGYPDRDCACDLPTCPGCCPDCNPAQGTFTDLMETTP